MRTPLAGIEARWWVGFLKLFDERADEETIRRKFESLTKAAGRDSEWIIEVVHHISRLMEM